MTWQDKLGHEATLIAWLKAPTEAVLVIHGTPAQSPPRYGVLFECWIEDSTMTSSMVDRAVILRRRWRGAGKE